MAGDSSLISDDRDNTGDDASPTDVAAAAAATVAASVDFSVFVVDVFGCRFSISITGGRTASSSSSAASS